MSNVCLNVGDRAYTNLNQIRGLSDESILSLVREFGHSLYQIPFKIEQIVENYAVVKYKKFLTTLPLYVLKYFPEVGDVEYNGRIVKATNLSERRVYFTNQEDIPLSRVHVVKKASDIKKEVKETPFEESFVILNNNLHCKVSKIGWNPKDGNILSVLDYCNNRYGSISEKRFMDEKPIFLTELGESIIYSLLYNNKRCKESSIVNVTLGLYDLKVLETEVGLSVIYKRFKDHPTEYNNGSTSLRAFCEEFSEQMIKGSKSNYLITNKLDGVDFRKILKDSNQEGIVIRPNNVQHPLKFKNPLYQKI